MDKRQEHDFFSQKKKHKWEKWRLCVCVYISACAAHVFYVINRTEKKKDIALFYPTRQKNI